MRPFAGAGVVLNYLTAALPTEGVNTGWGLCITPLLRLGFDITAESYRTNYLFCSADFTYGLLPNWEVKLLPDLRPIRNGEYITYKHGLGIAIDYFPKK